MITYPNVKLNLGLRVLRRREDGYHDLDTLFIPCDRFHDTLEIITGDDYSRTSAHLQETYSGAQLAQGITPDGKLMVTLARKEGVDWDPLKDLTARAYGLLAQEHKLPPMKVYLEKTSPVGADSPSVDDRGRCCLFIGFRYPLVQRTSEPWSDCS